MSDYSELSRKESDDLFWLYVKAAASDDPEELAELAKSDCDPVRRRVAMNARTSRDTLELLSCDWNAQVRAAVAGNPQTPHATRAGLARDRKREVRLALVEALAADVELLRSMTLDEDDEVSSLARRTERETGRFEPPYILPEIPFGNLAVAQPASSVTII